MADEVDYHGRLKRLAQNDSAMGHGFGDPMTIVTQRDLLGAVAEHEATVHELADVVRSSQVVEAEVRRLGDEVQGLRARLKLEQGDTLNLEVRGNVVLSDADLDKLIKSLTTRLGASLSPPGSLSRIIPVRDGVTWLGFQDPMPAVRSTVADASGREWVRYLRMSESSLAWWPTDEDEFEGDSEALTWSELTRRHGPVRLVSTWVDEKEEDEDE